MSANDESLSGAAAAAVAGPAVGSSAAVAGPAVGSSAAVGSGAATSSLTCPDAVPVPGAVPSRLSASGAPDVG